jgi:hypothetical protein
LSGMGVDFVKMTIVVLFWWSVFEVEFVKN